MRSRPIAAVLSAVLTSVVAVASAAPTAEPDPAVAGGEPTTVAEAPWHVAVARHQSTRPGEENGFQRHGCGGSLIAPTIVLTAAHCVFDFGDPLPFLPTADCEAEGGYHSPPDDYSVISGRTTLSSDEGEEIDVREIYFFVAGENGGTEFEAQTAQSGGDPLFDCVKGAWDAVLLELEEPSSQRPIRIAGPRERRLWRPGTDATAVGWGVEDESSLVKSDELRSVSLPVIADRYCASEQGYPGRFSAASMVCAGPLDGGAGACGGDSGGGLTVDAPGRARRLVASLSFSEGCGRKGKPGVFARLAGTKMRPAIGRAVQEVVGVDVIGRPRRNR